MPNDPLIDVARDNPDVICSLKQGKAEQVLSALVRDNLVDPTVLTERVLDSQHAPALLPIMVRGWAGKSDAIFAIAMTLYNAGGGVWDAFNRADVKHLVELFDKANLFGLLVVRDDQALTDPYHPLFSLLSSEAYWDTLVASFLGKGDHERAWETACHALRGYYPKGMAPSPLSHAVAKAPFGQDGTHQISTETFGRLIRVIHADMAARGLVPAEVAPCSSYTLWDSVSIIQYPKAMRRDSRGLKPSVGPRSYRAGRKYAQRFANPTTLAAEGVMVLQIAAHFVEREQEKRRVAWQELCRAHGVDPDELEKEVKSV